MEHPIENGWRSSTRWKFLAEIEAHPSSKLAGLVLRPPIPFLSLENLPERAALLISRTSSRGKS